MHEYVVNYYNNSFLLTCCVSREPFPYYLCNIPVSR